MMFNWDTDIEVRTQEAHRLDVLTAAATGLEDAVKTILNKMAKVVKGFRSGDYGQVETWIQQEWRTKPDKDVRAPIRREFIFKVDRTKPHKDVRAALKSVLKLVDDFKGTYQMKMILAEHVKNNLIKAKITDEMQKQEQRILMVQLYKCRDNWIKSIGNKISAAENELQDPGSDTNSQARQGKIFQILHDLAQLEKESRNEGEAFGESPYSSPRDPGSSELGDQSLNRVLDTLNGLKQRVSNQANIETRIMGEQGSAVRVGTGRAGSPSVRQLVTGCRGRIPGSLIATPRC
eukprot:GHVU01026076.1.p1 GENE.GHVU01026076.1~~GHVU01026076.1.p1  ORF type:complete len:291 (+),score=26.74 GHVU01026076.1:2544-3416(+)